VAGAACIGCHHGIFNPYGYALEGFDAVGSVQAVDNGAPVDTIAGVFTADGTRFVNGAQELMQALADSRGAWSCYAEQLVSHVFAWQLSGEDLCLVEALVDDIASGRPIRELSARLTLADSFRLRADEHLVQLPSPTPGTTMPSPTGGDTPSSGGSSGTNSSGTNGSGTNGSGTNGSGPMTATDSGPSLTEPEATDENDTESEATDEDNTDSVRPDALEGDNAQPSPDAGPERFGEIELNGIDDTPSAGGCGCRTFAAPTGTRQSSWAFVSMLALALIARKRSWV
jgi:hypothetical protein